MALRRIVEASGCRSLTARRRSAKPQKRVQLPPAPLIVCPGVPLSWFTRTDRRRARGRRRRSPRIRVVTVLLPRARTAPRKSCTSLMADLRSRAEARRGNHWHDVASWCNDVMAGSVPGLIGRFRHRHRLGRTGIRLPESRQRPREANRGFRWFGGCGGQRCRRSDRETKEDGLAQFHFVVAPPRRRARPAA